MPPCQRIVVPAYFDPPAAPVATPSTSSVPAAGWLPTGYAPTLSTVVANPANGPGVTRDAAYAAAVAQVRAAGIAVFGYIDTDYGRRPAADVLRDVRAYLDWYGVEGVFFDQATHDVPGLGYYRPLVGEVRSARPGLRVVLNAGTTTDAAYYDLADAVVTFEGGLDSYLRATVATAPAAPRDRGWHLVYGVPAGELARVLSLARSNGVSTVYVTDATLPNPWNRMPPYLAEMVALVARENSGCRPTGH